MSGPWHPTGRGRVSMRSPQALAICQRCGFTYNRVDLVPQFQWAGPRLQNLELYVCKRTCLDVPQAQLRSIIIPPDPVPVHRPFPENYDTTVPSFLETDTGSTLLTEDGSALLWESQDTPLPDPNNPALYPPE